MPNIVELQNGRLKVMRGRFGGDKHRSVTSLIDGSRLGGDLRREFRGARARHKEAMSRDESRQHPRSNSEADLAVSTEPMCDISGETRPTNGKVEFQSDQGDQKVTLVYKEGKLVSAHVCANESDAGEGAAATRSRRTGQATKHL